MNAKPVRSRRGRRNLKTRVSAVTVTQRDGSVAELPAYDRRELAAIVHRHPGARRSYG